MTRDGSRHPPIWALVSVAWLGPAILAAFEAFLTIRYGGWTKGTWQDVAFQGGDWLIYGFLTPAVFVLSRRFPLARTNLRRYLPFHFAASIGLCAAWAGAGDLLRWAIIPGQHSPTVMSLVSWFFTSLPFGVAVYFAVLGVERAAHYFVEAKEREAQLVEARLGALRMQLQPHFLLNSLNAITVIVRDKDTATASRMLEQLGDMLRRVMRADRPQEVTLADEMAFVRQYLGIEEMRFSDRLTTSFDIPDELFSALVPEFLLQPLVENALRHGVARREAATRLTVAARRDGDVLVLSVRDEGPDAAAPAPSTTEGVGLSNTRARLATLYGDRGSLELHRRAAGAEAVARLPYRVATRG
ncbi:MAG TPA: histidine kinase [Gemmatimonadales bacterium]